MGVPAAVPGGLACCFRCSSGGGGFGRDRVPVPVLGEVTTGARDSFWVAAAEEGSAVAVPVCTADIG